jgi:hypothetical protein
VGDAGTIATTPPSRRSRGTYCADTASSPTHLRGKRLAVSILRVWSAAGGTGGTGGTGATGGTGGRSGRGGRGS